MGFRGKDYRKMNWLYSYKGWSLPVIHQVCFKMGYRGNFELTSGLRVTCLIYDVYPL